MRSKSISISLELWERIKKECNDNISISSFIRMTTLKELERRGMLRG
ncbi:hypothetical protein J4403_04190 [Candidatus Woesearchaeota archaeon]|nr:hypothetical protein [Candidatus Woesearchaeota archaeon]